MLSCSAPRVHEGCHGDLPFIGFASLTPIVVPERHVVIADTTGFHARGRAAPGTIRRFEMLAKAGDWKSDSVPRHLTLPVRRSDLPVAVQQHGLYDRSKHLGGTGRGDR